MTRRIYIGTAGWSIPRASADRFDSVGTHLERYARLMRCVEINSSFYRPHRPATYLKWAEAVPRDFRFAVKVPKHITHELKLRRSRAPIERFLGEVAGLGERLGPLLVQLPPSFAFDARAVAAFFTLIRERHGGPIVCEPRHPTWFSARADALMSRFSVGRVSADPVITEASESPGGWEGIAYFRLHGSPRMYWSRYEPAFISALARRVRRLAKSRDVWCIFDNTAAGAALENALELSSH